MKTIIAMLALSFSAYAQVPVYGKAEANRDLARYKADRDYSVEMCKKQTKEPVKDCIKRHDDLLKDVQKDIKSRSPK